MPGHRLSPKIPAVDPPAASSSSLLPPPSLPPSFFLPLLPPPLPSPSFFNSPVVRLHFFFCTYSLLPWKRFMGKWGRAHRRCRNFLGRLFCHVAPLTGSFREARPHHKGGDLSVALAGVHSSWTSSHQVRAFACCAEELDALNPTEGAPGRSRKLLPCPEFPPSPHILDPGW